MIDSPLCRTSLTEIWVKNARDGMRQAFINPHLITCEAVLAIEAALLPLMPEAKAPAA
jgi:hypothetical protein